MARRLRRVLGLAALLIAAGAVPAHAAVDGSFERGLGGWQADGLWRAQTHPELVAISPAIAGRLTDVPEGATLPTAWAGAGAAWFGDPVSGTYCAGFASVRQHPSDGCTSDRVVGGSLTSPAFELAEGSASMSFHAWWEISGGSPDLTDLMIVEYSVDGGESWTQAGRLNPDAPPWGSRHQQWSESGHKGSGTWVGYAVDLSPAAGHSDVRVRFRFDSVDEYGQGFRGLLIDGVEIGGVAPEVAAPDAQLVLGARISALGQNGKPIRGRSVTIDRESGGIMYTLPGETEPRVLVKRTLVPVGTIVDAADGRVKVTSAIDDEGGTQSGSFYQGVFQILQRPDDAVVDLVLRGGTFPHCEAGCDAGAAHAQMATTRRVRHLWGDAHGSFRTRGRFASATVRGTNWLVEDRISGTLVKVKRGSVLVHDHGLGRDIVVNAGESYFARALFVNKQSNNPRFKRHYSLLVTRDGKIVHVYEKRKIVLPPRRGKR